MTGTLIILQPLDWNLQQTMPLTMPYKQYWLYSESASFYPLDDNVRLMLTGHVLRAQRVRERNPFDSPAWGPPYVQNGSLASPVHDYR
jgi:hypothetical protein